MSDSVGNLADKIAAIKERGERDSQFRELLLTNPDKILSEQGIMDNIASVSAEYHADYGLCILVTFKANPSASPAPSSSNEVKNVQNYDFLECHNF